MKVFFDRVKREKTLNKRQRDFARFNEIMDGPTFTQEDTRHDYPESRFQTYGLFGWKIGHGSVDSGPARRSGHLDEKMQ